MDDSRRVRLGVVGVGDFGVRHVATAAALPEVDLVAVADRDTARAKAVGERYGARWFAGSEDLFAAAAIDAVVIATPESRHLADLEVAIRAGAAALVEKPIVATAEQAERIQAMMRDAVAPVVPAHVSRFLPAFAALRERVRDDTVHSVRAVRIVPTARLDLHGGEHPALVAMVHDLDLVHALVPGPAQAVSSVQVHTDRRRPYPQVVMAHLTFGHGAVASVENYWVLPHERQYIDARLEVATSREIIRFETPSGALRVSAADGDFLPDTELEAWVAGLPVGALATQLRHFIKCVESGRPSEVVSVDDALWSVEVALRIAEQSSR